MLVKSRLLKAGDRYLATTPLLIPSFSSKGFPRLNKIVNFSQQFITDIALVSSYDVFYQHIAAPPTFPEIVFLDSGGYEASKDREFSDLGYLVHEPKPWNEYFHREVLSTWPKHIPTVFVSYDHPDARFPFAEQIERAQRLVERHENAAYLLLIKPEEAEQDFVDINKISQQIELLSDFDAVGVTEKELGESLLKRMLNIARLRMSMDRAKIELPIQVFGSLDTLSTPLYFLAGADIFDGLTWLRFAYSEGYTAYRNNYGALRFGLDADHEFVEGASRKENLYYLRALRNQMYEFSGRGDFGCFQHHGEFLESAQRRMMSVLGG